MACGGARAAFTVALLRAIECSEPSKLKLKLLFCDKMKAVTKKQILEQLQFTPEVLKAYERELLFKNSRIKKAYLFRLVLIGICWFATKYISRSLFHVENYMIQVLLALAAILSSSMILTLYGTNPILLEELSHTLGSKSGNAPPNNNGAEN